jgi:hypothetical protein
VKNNIDKDKKEFFLELEKYQYKCKESKMKGGFGKIYYVIKQDLNGKKINQYNNKAMVAKKITFDGDIYELL